MEEGVEDGAVELGLLGDVTHSVSRRQQRDEPRGSALSSGSDVEEERAAVQLQRRREQTGANGDPDPD